MPSQSVFQLPAPSSIGTVILAQGIGASHTGDTNETILATIPVSAGAMGANGVVVVQSLDFLKTGTAGNWTFRAYFGLSGAGLGGTLVWSPAAATSAQVSVAGMRLSLVNAGATNSQRGPAQALSGITTGVTIPLTAAIDTTQATELVVSVQLGNGTDTAALMFYQALLYPHT